MTVYFIQQGGHDGPVKVGYTAGRGVARLKALQCGNPNDLRLLSDIPGTPRDETYLHTIWAEYRIRGEWFKPEGSFRSYLNNVAIPMADFLPPVMPRERPTMAERTERSAAGMAFVKSQGGVVGRTSKLTRKQWAQAEHQIITSKMTLPEIAAKFGLSKSGINNHFPGWRSKSPAQRKAWRVKHPLPLRTK